MYALSPRIEVKADRETPFPSRLIRGLWRLHKPDEAIVNPYVQQNGSSLWYQASDGFIGSVLFFRPGYFSNKDPIVVILGPLLHPCVTLFDSIPWIQQLLQQGHPIYAISHRSHRQYGTDIYSIKNLDCSFHTMATDDIHSALLMIDQHSGSRQHHLVGQDLGSILSLHVLSIFEPTRFASIHLFNTPFEFPSSLKSTLLSYIHQDTSMQQVWNRHLTTKTLPKFSDSLSIEERSALLYSDSWLAKDWVSTVRMSDSLRNFSISNEISFLRSLPEKVSCPVHCYSSHESALSSIDSLSSHVSLWNIFRHSLSSSVFPLLDSATQLHI